MRSSSAAPFIEAAIPKRPSDQSTIIRDTLALAEVSRMESHALPLGIP